MTATFHVGDAIEVMSKLPEKSVDLILTSPPFLALRSYLPADHPDKSLEGGSQATPGQYIDWLIDVVEACDRVLAPHGSLCIELGDTYAGSGGAGGDYDPGGWREGQAAFEGSGKRYIDSKYERIQYGDKGPPIANLHGKKQGGGSGWPLAKSLSLIPELFRFTLVYGVNPLTGRTTERWRLRNVVRWVRPNPPVGALGDKFRPATSELMVFCKSAKRFFDLDAVREPHKHWNGVGEEPGAAGRAVGLDTRNRERAKVGNSSLSPSDGKSNPAGAPPLDWWNIPLLEGEEETRYGPKERPTLAPEKPNPKQQQARAEGISRGALAEGTYHKRGGSPPLDWWNIPSLDGNEDLIELAGKALEDHLPEDLKPYSYSLAETVLYTYGRSYKARKFKLNPIPDNDSYSPLDWWNIPPGGYEGAHYAVFPPELCIKPIKAMSPERVCRQCGEPSRRILEKSERYREIRERVGDFNTYFGPNDPGTGNNGNSRAGQLGKLTSAEYITTGFSDCGHDDWRPGLVLDPFGGSGTTALVATGHGRDCILIDLDERNFDLALQRVGPFILERAT